jgi:CRP/FNR family transcriptional regulator, dissimilatory nitrate respiration regulator
MATAPIKAQAFLGNLPLFRELSPGEIDRIAAQTRQLHCSRGEIVFHRGDPCNGFHVVVYGQIKLAFISAQGDEKVIEILSQGQSFGEAVLFLEKPYPVAANALVDTLLLHVSKEVVFDEIDRDPRFARRIIAGMAMRLHQLVGDVEAYSMRSGTERVIGFLLRDEVEDLAEGKIEVTLPASKGVIASRLNLTQEHFSRILHDLIERKLIEVEGRKVTLCDVQKLRTHQA